MFRLCFSMSIVNDKAISCRQMDAAKWIYYVLINNAVHEVFTITM